MSSKRFIVSRSQKIGFAGLSLILLALLIIKQMDANGSFSDPFEVDQADLQFFSNHIAQDSNSMEVELNEPLNEAQLFEFNPNNLSAERFEDLGFSEKQALSIVNYRENYGEFRNKESFAKLYVVSEEKFQELEPYIVLDAPNETTLIEINSATGEELQDIPGIGPTYAQRIIKYRNLIGGFVSSEQFSEVYGLKDETILKLIKRTIVDSENVTQLNVNSASKDELDKHPYFDFETIALVLDERESRKIHNLDFLNHHLTTDQINKLKPYVSFE